MSKIEISRCNPWLKKVTATHPVYHLDGDFVAQSRRVSRQYAIYDVNEPGIYQGPKLGKGQMVAGSRRIDSGLIRVDEAGDVCEITLDDARAALEATLKMKNTT